MRIDHAVDPAQGHALIHHRILPPPVTPAPRRVAAVNQPANPDAPVNDTTPPDDGISLALSAEAREAARRAALEQMREHAFPPPESSEEAPREPAEERKRDEEAEIERLAARDREVRQHEQAHAATAGELATGGIIYHYEVGPDGRLYAVGGELDIDLSPVPGDPEATLRKAEQIQQAALAPGDPSPTDRNTAAAAAALAARARFELAKQEQAQGQEPGQGNVAHRA